ncbi:MAG: hypothetical protein ABJD66_03280 [Cellulophaga sp.]|uniref:hypothetical protein n=1 Tax=Cellulophaga sp. TaxID=1972202 RepID=UPI003263C2A8
MYKYAFVLLILILGCKSNKNSIEIKSNELIYYEYTQKYVQQVKTHLLSNIAFNIKIKNNSDSTIIIGNKNSFEYYNNEANNDFLAINDTLFELTPYKRDYIKSFKQSYHILPKHSMNISFSMDIPLIPGNINRIKKHLKNKGGILKISSLIINKKDTILNIPFRINNLKEVFIKNNELIETR